MGAEGRTYAESDAFPISADRARPFDVTFGGATRVVSLPGRAVDALHSLNNEPPLSWAAIRERQYLANSIALSQYLYKSCAFGVNSPTDRTSEPEIRTARVWIGGGNEP